MKPRVEYNDAVDMFTQALAAEVGSVAHYVEVICDQVGALKADPRFGKDPEYTVQAAEAVRTGLVNAANRGSALVPRALAVQRAVGLRDASPDEHDTMMIRAAMGSHLDGLERGVREYADDPESPRRQALVDSCEIVRIFISRLGGR